MQRAGVSDCLNNTDPELRFAWIVDTLSRYPEYHEPNRHIHAHAGE
jgi:hypothetical protein